MEGGNIDNYNAKFTNLANKAGYTLNEEVTLNMYAQGLPFKLMESILRQHRPVNWRDWTEAAVEQQRIYNLLQSHLRKPTGNQNTRREQWRRNIYNNQNRNPNAMNVDRARARATMTEDQKQQYQREGRCFRCGNTGHISRNCPQRQNAQISTVSTNSTTPQIAATVKVEGTANCGAKERAAAHIAAMQAESDDVKAALEEQLFGKQGFSKA